MSIFPLLQSVVNSVLRCYNYRKACLSYLEQRVFEEELPEDAAAAPDVDGWPVALLTQQQLGRPVPQRDHLVGVGPLPVLGVVQAGKTKVGQFYFASERVTNKHVRI